jgi:tetratricopeptide (TPR) repeat protein
MSRTKEAREAVREYEEGVLLLDAPGRSGSTRLLTARRHLESAIAVRPKHAASHAALGYANDLLGRRHEQALACFRRALRLDPRDRISEVYALTLLAEMGRERQARAGIRAAAKRHALDLPKLRRELTAVRFPTDARTLLMNGFIHARNFMRSAIGGEAERIRNAREPGRARRQAAAERKACRQHQEALARRFDASRVPAALRALAPLASRYGIGDDVCRPRLLMRLAKAQRAKLIRAVDAHGRALHAWLGGFPRGKMTAEAEALLYLAQGIEEIR